MPLQQLDYSDSNAKRITHAVAHCDWLADGPAVTDGKSDEHTHNLAES